MLLSSGKKLGRYEIVAPLGAGRMGEVHRAKDSRLVHGLPLKSYRDTWRKRAMRLLGRAPHPDKRFDCVSYSDFLHRIGQCAISSCWHCEAHPQIPRRYAVLPDALFNRDAFRVRLAIPTLLVWRFGPKPVKPGHCRCGYDLRGNVSGTCPECGKEATHADP